MVRELAWQRRARGLAAEHDRSGYFRGELGPVPESTRGRRAAAAIEDYRRSYGITDLENALGPMPREPTQRAGWQHARQTITRVQGRQHSTDRDRQLQRAPASHPSPFDRHQQDQARARSGREVPPRRPGPERAAG